MRAAWTGYEQSQAAAEEPMPTPEKDFKVGTKEAKALAAKKSAGSGVSGSAVSAQDLDQSAPHRSEIALIDEYGRDITGAPMQYCTTPSAWRPNRVYIPSMCVVAPLLTSSAPNGSMQLPQNPAKLARLSTSADITADRGTSVISGHVNMWGVKGALYDLSRLSPGSSIYITDAAGRPREFVVNELRSYLKTDLPESLFDTAGPRRIALVTCGGKLIHGARGNHYEDNVVAYAVPAA